MRLPDPLLHALAHAAYSGVTVDQHHLKPVSVQASNTSLVVPPLPGGPSFWDISVPFAAQAVVFHFASVRYLTDGNGKAGVTGIANTQQFLAAAAVSIGGKATFMGYGSYSAVYTKASGALQLSDKTFDSTGDFIALTDAWLVATGPSTKVLRTQWTNYGSGNKTLNAYGEVGVLG